jgi:hypothetical protein
MKKRTLVVAVATGAVGLLGVASAGVAFADDGDPSTPPVQAGSGPHRYGVGGAGDGTGVMRGDGTGIFHEQIHTAVAEALGITIEDFDARRAEGQTVAEIAAELGVDVTTVKDAMADARPAGRGARMGGGGGNGPGPGPRSADCPNAQ